MHLRQDLRFALRLLRKTPALTGTAILVLGLGIGANTAIFSLVNSVVLQPLPYPHPDHLVEVVKGFPGGGTNDSASIPNFLDWRSQQTTFTGLAAFASGNFNLASQNSPPRRVTGYYVDSNFFSLLGVKLARGAGFHLRDDLASSARVAVISDRLWRSRFNADPGILGRPIRINDEAVPVVGVLPPNFRYQGKPADVFEPLQPEGMNGANDRGANLILVIGRIRPGVSFPAAQAQMHAIGDRLARAYPKSNAHSTVDLIPLQRYWSGDVRPVLWLLFGAVGLVLLIACADLANLLLAKASSRRSEIAVRMALGAAPRRIVAQLLTETMVLALIGGLLGLGIGWLALGMLMRLLPPDVVMSPTGAGALSPLVLLFTFALALATGVLFGLAPALQVSRIDLNTVLQQEGGRGNAGGRNRLRKLLILSELVLALPLLIAACLLLSSLVRLRSTNPGFQPRHLLTANLPLAAGRYRTPADLENLSTRLLPKLRALPGVTAAALTLALPLNDENPSLPFQIIGRAPNPNDNPGAIYLPSSPGIFPALGVPILRGRGILTSDTGSSAPVVVINRVAAERWWPHQNPVGQAIWIGKGLMGPTFTDVAPRTIVGIVGDVRQRNLHWAPQPIVYLPLSQTMPGVVPLIAQMLPLGLAIRTVGSPMAPARAVERAVWSIDPAQPVSDLRPMTDVEAATLAPQRFTLILLTVFAVLAVVLAVIGVYGVMSYTVAQRTHEVGLRMAIGASPAHILRLVLGEGLQLALLGSALGLAAALALNRVLASFLYGVKSWDPVVFLAAAATFVAVTILACWLPARRAARTDPWRALRQE